MLTIFICSAVTVLACSAFVAIREAINTRVEWEYLDQMVGEDRR